MIAPPPLSPPLLPPSHMYLHIFLFFLQTRAQIICTYPKEKQIQRGGELPQSERSVSQPAEQNGDTKKKKKKGRRKKIKIKLILRE